ncbi:MAG TPA: hypothetical protein ENF21_05930 [Bacteroidetes bacterium]|nr:hypothetical protein [Bacteroidota bacterium]
MMKMNKSKLTGWVLIVLFSMVQFSCKQGSKQKESEWQNVKAETNEVLQAEYDSVKQKIKDAMADLDDRMKTLEARMETEEARLSEKKLELQQELEDRKGKLQKKLQRLEEGAVEDFESFKKELNHDLKELEKGIKAFFEENPE